MNSAVIPTKTQNKSVAVVVVGAGRGRRMGAPLPKQYLDIAGAPVLRHTLTCFAEHPQVTLIQPVIHPDDRTLFDHAAEGLDVLTPVPGGATRQDSVRLGLESLARLDPKPDLVLIHDAARPFVSRSLIDRTLAALLENPGALPVLPVTDTMKSGAAGMVTGTVDRSTLWRAQTPQGFRFADILDAHRRCRDFDFTDDAAVAEHVGFSVVLVEGDGRNIKITTEDDLALARQEIEADPKPIESKVMETRIGTGFDVHRFGPGDFVTLCGVEIPHDHSLAGHSDADVALHALTDAVLGALGDGDIGSHFPPTDPQWKGASSDRFLAHAVGLVAGKGGHIINMDVTIICERPKLGPYRKDMRVRVADIVGIDVARVSVKATTTEQLGFTGRREGIAAQAAVSIALPAPS